MLCPSIDGREEYGQAASKDRLIRIYSIFIFRALLLLSRPFRGPFFVWPLLGRRTEGEADAAAEFTDRRGKVETVGDTAARSKVDPAAAAQHAAGARTGPCRVGLR